MNEAELERCPACGEHVDVWRYVHYFRVQCSCCPYRGPRGATDEEARSAWREFTAPQ